MAELLFGIDVALTFCGDEVFGDQKSRCLALDCIKLAANFGRRVRLAVERLQVRRPAELEEHDDAFSGRLARLPLRERAEVERLQSELTALDAALYSAETDLDRANRDNKISRERYGELRREFAELRAEVVAAVSDRQNVLSQREGDRREPA